MPLTDFIAMASRNPLVHLEAAVFRKSSYYRRFIAMAGQPPPAPPVPVSGQPEPWRLLWRWLAAPHPLAHNPYPQLRAARQQETWRITRLLLAYYLANQLAASLLGICSLMCWGSVQCIIALLQRRTRRGTPKLTDRALHRVPVTLTVPTSPVFSLPIPRLLMPLVASCRTAKRILAILAAHQDWPASLSHHGAQPGGLLTHTLRACDLALTHRRASDERLGKAFLLIVLAHDAGKVLAYVPRPAGGYTLSSYYHANKSADLLVAAGLLTDFPPSLAEAMLIALRASAAKSLVPIPDNAPPEANTLLHWLTEVDRLAVSQDVADLKLQVEQADVRSLLPALFAASAPSADLPPPLYRDGGAPYLLREPARLVLLNLLGLQEHPGARATTGRRDPVWERVKSVLQEAGATEQEIKIAVPGRQRPFLGLAVPPALLQTAAGLNA